MNDNNEKLHKEIMQFLNMEYDTDTESCLVKLFCRNHSIARMLKQNFIQFLFSYLQISNFNPIFFKKLIYC